MTTTSQRLFCDLDSVSPFSNLPIEVVVHILSFLRYRDIQTSRLVCRQWYEASLDQRILDREKVKLISPQEQGLLPAGVHKLQLVRAERPFPHLCVVEDDGAWDNKKFWDHMSQNLRSLLIFGCHVPKIKLFTVLKNCSKLKSIKFENCELTSTDTNDEVKLDLDTDLPELPGLRILKIVANNESNLKLFDTFLARAGNLKKLCLEDSVGVDNGALKLEDILKYWRDNKDRVIELGLSTHENLEGDFEHLKELLALPNLRLINFKIPSCPINFYKNQTCMQKFELTKKISNSDLEIICSSLTSLKKLSLNCKNISTGARKLASLRKLTSLTLLACSKMTATDLLIGLCSDVNKILELLAITHLRGIPNSFIVELARTHPALRYLDLKSCDSVTDWSIQAVFHYQISLEVFCLRECDVTDVGLSGEILYGPLNEDDKENPTGYSMDNLKRLQVLSLEECVADGSAFEHLVFPVITWVILDHSYKVTEKALQCFVKNNPTIERLSIAACGVTDNFIKLIVQNLPQLQYVNIIDCTEVTESAVKLLEERCRNVLHSITTMEE